MSKFILMWEGWLWSVGILIAAIVAGLVAHKIIYSSAGRIARRTSSGLDDSFLLHSRKPAGLLIPLLGVLIVMPALHFPPALHDALSHVVGLLIITSISWMAIAMTAVFSDMITSRYDVTVKDNLAARRVHTQVQVLRRTTVVVVVVITISIMLMTFPAIRSIGAGLFASAGIAGLVLGMAARPTLSNLIAGVQMALTEPIRLDDVVIVEGEWGWIEEISTTYVVVRIWDLRRLIVPLSYFIEKPFQNWTRRSSSLLCTVFIYTDYSVPVDEMRNEVHAILQASKLWDGKTWGLQVTNATENTVELRALMSAEDSGKAWDLRCEVREKLIKYLQDHYPDSLPKSRVEIKGSSASKINHE